MKNTIGEQESGLGIRSRYSFRCEEGLYVGIEGDGHKAYLLDGETITIVDAPQVVGGKAPLLYGDIMEAGEFADGFSLPVVLRQVLAACDNTELPLPAEEVAEVLAVWVYVGVLDKPTKPILSLVGQPGSTKTATTEALRMWLEGIRPGPEAKVVMLPNGPHNFEVVASNHRFLALDNVDNAPRWLLDLLAGIATGAGAANRKLYSNGQEFNLSIRSTIAITSMNMPFNRPDVTDRTLVVELRRLNKFMPEDEYEKMVESWRWDFWCALLHDLSRLIALERERRGSVLSEFRMADYGFIGSLVWGERTGRILAVLGGAQANIALRDDELMATMADLARKERRLSGSAGQIFSRLKMLPGVELPPEVRNAKGFADYLRLRAVAARHIGLEIAWKPNAHTKTNVYTVTWKGEQAAGVCGG